jgi:glutaredoxin
MRLTLYGRTYCHLCEDMAAALRELREPLGFTLEIVDVDADPATEARYGDLVPVLTDPQGEEICHYFLDIGALQARLAVK